MTVPDLLPEVRRLMSENKGDRVIAETLEITWHQARNLMREVERANGGAVDVPFNEVLRLDPEAWAIRISARWRMGVEAIISTGRLLVEAKAALPHGGFGACLQQLPFGERQAQMLMAIASHPRMSNPQYVALLPPSWGTIYDATRLSDDEWAVGIEKGIIRPDMERADIEQIRPRLKALPPPNPAGVAEPPTRDNMEGSTGQSAPGEIPGPGTSSDGGVESGHAGAEEGRVSQVDAGLSTVTSAAGVAPGPSEANPDAPAAHMASRVTAPGDLDFSPTPPWATRALVERVLRSVGREGHCRFQTAWEPACGEGHMAEVLREYFRRVRATDIHERGGYPDAIEDFLDPDAPRPEGKYDWIITNPPFEDRVIKFMDRALDLAGTGVAMFLQLRYLEGIGRYERIYKDRPPTIVAPFVERVPLLMDRYDPNASTTTAFMWLVWLKGAAPKAPFWIPPGCKAALTKPDDAERFTQKPVARGVYAVSAEPEILSPSEPQQPGTDDLDIPEFLKRQTA